MRNKQTKYIDVRTKDELDILESIEFKNDIDELKIYSGRNIIRNYYNVPKGIFIIEPILLAACKYHKIEITTVPDIDETDVIFYQNVISDDIKQLCNNFDYKIDESVKSLSIKNMRNDETYIGGMMGIVHGDMYHKVVNKLYKNFYIIE